MSQDAVAPRRLLLALEDLEHFILDYTLRRRPERERLQAIVEVELDVGGTLSQGTMNLLRDHWQYDDRPSPIVDPLEIARDHGILDDIRAGVHPRDVAQRIEEVISDLAADLADDFYERFITEADDWFARDLRRVELSDGDAAQGSGDEIRDRWLDQWRPAIDHDAVELAIAQFQHALIATDGEDNRTPGPFARFVLRWQENRWRALHPQRLLPIDLSEVLYFDPPLRQTARTWQRLLDLYLSAVESAAQAVPSSAPLTQLAAARISEIRTWEPVRVAKSPDGEGYGGHAPYLDNLCRELDFHRATAESLMRHLRLVEALRPKRDDGTPNGHAAANAYGAIAGLRVANLSDSLTHQPRRLVAFLERNGLRAPIDSVCVEIWGDEEKASTALRPLITRTNFALDAQEAAATVSQSDGFVVLVRH